MPGKFRPGQPVTPGNYTASSYSVTVGSNGDIKVKPGDWISK